MPKRIRETTIDLRAWKKEIEKVPFIHLLGMKVVSIDEKGLELEMRVTPKLINYMGGVHGGGIVSLIDTAVFFAIRPLLPREKGLTTTEIKVNFFRALGEGTCRAKAKVLHLGKRTAVGEAEVFDGKGALVAKGTVGHAVLQERLQTLKQVKLPALKGRGFPVS